MAPQRAGRSAPAPTAAVHPPQRPCGPGRCRWTMTSAASRSSTAYTPRPTPRATRSCRSRAAAIAVLFARAGADQHVSPQWGEGLGHQSGKFGPASCRASRSAAGERADDEVTRPQAQLLAQRAGLRLVLRCRAQRDAAGQGPAVPAAHGQLPVDWPFVLRAGARHRALQQPAAALVPVVRWRAGRPGASRAHWTASRAR
jgi:hypothetical protein